MTPYFSHDHDAKNDPNTKRMIRKLGWQAYGIYWSLIEDLHREEGWLDKNYEEIAYDHHVSEDLVKEIIEGFNLFTIEDERFTSHRVLRNLENIVKRSNNGKMGAEKLWKDKYQTLHESCKFPFDPVWEIMPRQTNKIDAITIFSQTILTEDDLKKLVKSINNYKRYNELNGIDPKYYLGGKKFMETWQEWLDWKEPDNQFKKDRSHADNIVEQYRRTASGQRA